MSNEVIGRSVQGRPIALARIGDPEAPDGEEPADGCEDGAARDHEIGTLAPDAGDGRALLTAHAGEAPADPVDGGEIQTGAVDPGAVVADKANMNSPIVKPLLNPPTAKAG